MSSPDAGSPETLKKEAIADFSRHVSSAKARFWQQLEMDVVMGRREGPFFWDLDGKKRYWNLHCNGGVYNLGHRHPGIIRELELAMRDLDMGNGHLISKARADLGRRLAELMPGDLDYVVFGVSGGEAVDLSIKVARAFTGRAGIISALGGYHGHTGLAMAAGDTKYRAPFGPPCPGFRQVPFNDIDALKTAVGGGHPGNCSGHPGHARPRTGLFFRGPAHLPGARRPADFRRGPDRFRPDR
jgi:putrescine aminotransferase